MKENRRSIKKREGMFMNRIRSVVLVSLGACFLSLVSSEPIQITNIASEPIGANPNSGSITVTATGGQGALLYQLRGVRPFQPSGFFDNLASAPQFPTYVIDVTDGFTTATDTVTLGNAIPLTIDQILIGRVSCNGGSDGSLAILTKGGKPPVLYAITRAGGMRTPWQTGNLFLNLPAGLYDIEVLSDDGNNPSFARVEITEPNAITIGLSFDSPQCNGGRDGFIDTFASGGVPPYEYSLDGVNYQSSPSFDNLRAGDYTVFVRDSRGCVAQENGTLGNPTEVIITDINSTNVTCNGAADGTITVTAEAQDPAPLRYSVDGGDSFQDSPVFTGLEPATYMVVAEQEATSECSVRFVVISQPTALTFTTKTTPQDCIANTGGSIICAATGGIPPYSYSINGGVSFQQSNTFTHVDAGTYQVVVKDANGCTVKQVAIVTSIRGMTGNSLTDFITVKYCDGCTIKQ